MLLLRLTGRVLRSHAVLAVALAVASLVAAVVYALTGGGYPRDHVADAPRLDALDLRGDMPAATWREGEFECLGWRATHGCDPFGPRDVAHDRSCSEPMPRTSGFCEVRNRSSGDVLRVMLSTCKSWRWRLVPQLSCSDARQFTDFSLAAATYSHPQPTSSALSDYNDVDDASKAEDEALKRGVAMVAYPKAIAGVYAIVRSLRSLGCQLPVELWIDPLEMLPSHSVLQALTRHHGCVVRTILDRHATKFHAKPYAVYHSRFASVLFLDSDNIPVRDPTYLFESPEFLRHGAVFWPDFWRPALRTPFNVQAQSALWRLLDMPFTDMFEQESGQLLVHRQRSTKALSRLMFYSARLPRLLTDWELVYGDKDLFRLAWLATDTPFHMVQPLPMLGGRYSHEEDYFCGLAMVQRDPVGHVVFLHRNQAKLSGRSDSQRVLLTHLQRFTGGDGSAGSLSSELDKYRIKAERRRLGQDTCFSMREQTLDGSATPYELHNLEKLDKIHKMDNQDSLDSLDNLDNLDNLDSTRWFPEAEQRAVDFSIEARSLLSAQEEAEVHAIEAREEARQALEAQVAEDFADRVRKLLMALAGVVGAVVGWLIVRALGPGMKRKYKLKHKFVEGESRSAWERVSSWMCGMKKRRSSLLARVGGGFLGSQGADVSVLVFPTTPIDLAGDGGGDVRGSSTSVVVTHGENRRRKTSFQVDDV